MTSPRVEVELHQREIDALRHHPQVRDGVEDVGEAIAHLAAMLAPKRTGAGAASIHVEMVVDEAHVSWDQLHDYMRFQEFGTHYVTAKHFLSRAADSAR